jgi:hypothetical protein
MKVEKFLKCFEVLNGSFSTPLTFSRGSVEDPDPNPDPRTGSESRSRIRIH